MVTFKLHRHGVVLLALGSLLAAVLLFVGGCLVGEWRVKRAAEEPAEAAEAAGEPGRQGAGALRTTAPSLRTTAPSLRAPAPSVRVTTPSVGVTAPSAGTAARSLGSAATSAGSAGSSGGSAAPSGGSAGGATPSALAGPPEMPEQFTLRLGAFPSEEEAQALVERLAARGYTAAVSPVTARNGATLHLVLVGTYASRWEARGAAAELERREEREGLRAVVVPAPQ